MIIGSSPLKAPRGFTRLLTLGPHGISQSAHKLAHIYIYIYIVIHAVMLQ